MTQQTEEFSETELNLAASQEENQRLLAENQSLRRRVVLLRAGYNRAMAELNPKTIEPTPETEENNS